jgi:hypothetical protein
MFRHPPGATDVELRPGVDGERLRDLVRKVARAGAIDPHLDDLEGHAGGQPIANGRGVRRREHERAREDGAGRWHVRVRRVLLLAVVLEVRRDGEDAEDGGREDQRQCIAGRKEVLRVVDGHLATGHANE